MLREGGVRTGERQDRVVRPANSTLPNRPGLGLLAIQKMGHLVEARDDEPFIGVRTLQRYLDVDRGVLSAPRARNTSIVRWK